MSGDRKRFPTGPVPERPTSHEYPSALPARGVEADRSQPRTDPMRYVRHERQEAVAQINRSLLAWRKARGEAVAPTSSPNGGGAPLAPGVRTSMETQLGSDLSQARIHTGGESAKAATDLGARAFTVNNDVHFGAGEFAPGTKEGDRLLAHEMTHVVQGQKSGVQRKATAEEAESHGGHDVSHPEDAAEKEADATGDRVADALHSKQANGKAGVKPTAAPAPISAKFGGSAVVHRAGIRPTDRTAKPATPTATTGDPKVAAAEKFCDQHQTELTSFNPEKDWNTSTLKMIESGLRQLISSPEVAKNAKVLATQQLIKQKKSAVEDYCVAEMAKVGQELLKLDEHNARSYARAQALGASITHWQPMFPNSIAGVRGWDAWTMARKRVDSTLNGIVANRDAALQNALSRISAVKTEEPNAQQHLSSAYDAVQMWLDSAAKMPDAAGLGNKVRDAYFDKKLAIVGAQHAKTKAQQPAAPHTASQGAAHGASDGNAPGGKATHAPAHPAAQAAPVVAQPAAPRLVKPAAPAPLPHLPNHGLQPVAAETHGAAATTTAHATPPGHQHAPIPTAPQAPAPVAGSHVQPALDGTEAAAFHQLTVDQFTRGGDPHEVMRTEVLGKIEEVRKKNPALAGILDSIPIEQLMAIYGYSTEDYLAINSALRGYVPRDRAGNDTRGLKDKSLKTLEPAELLKRIKPYISLATVGLSKLPRHQGRVFRSMYVEPGTDRFQGWLKEGNVMRDAAFMSTSTYAKIEMTPSDNFKLTIEHQNGRRMEFLSAHDNEEEVLFAPGTGLQIQKVEKELDGDRTLYYVACKEV